MWSLNLLMQAQRPPLGRADGGGAVRRTVSQRTRPASARRRPSATFSQFTPSPAPETPEPVNSIGDASFGARTGQAGTMSAASDSMAVAHHATGDSNGLEKRILDVRNGTRDTIIRPAS